MKKYGLLFLMTFLTFSSLSIAPAYATDANCKENVLDNAWDWYTTLGKQGLEKDQVLAQNKVDRLKHCIEKAAKEAGDAASKASTEIHGP